ncbi:MAG: diaminopimelate epimerase [Ignavibacteria bacterium]|nr:diaminopimelate epimerase [Ignavibacteria bacterium]
MDSRIIMKYTGAGNNFIMINNLDLKINNYNEITTGLCSRKENEEIDGVIFVETTINADLKMNYFNKDGSGGSLCGNGLRCTVKYSLDNNLIKKEKLTVEAVNKIYKCEKIDEKNIKVEMPDLAVIKPSFKLKVNFDEWWEELECGYVDCGSPHLVVFIDDIQKPVIKELSEVNVNEWGRNLRMHRDLMPEGANVNFVKIINDNEIHTRTFERGVERETLSSGTGSISSAIISYIKRNLNTPVKILPKYGEYIVIDFVDEDGKIKNLTITGRANRI